MKKPALGRLMCLICKHYEVGLGLGMHIGIMILKEFDLFIIVFTIPKITNFANGGVENHRARYRN